MLSVLFLAGAAAAAPLRVAVQGFQNLTGRAEDAWIGPVAADAVGQALAGAEGIAVVERRELAALVREIQISQLGGSDAEIGALAGADVIVTGAVAVTPKGVRVTVKVLDVAAGTTKTSLTDDGPAEKLLARLDALAGRVASALGRRAGAHPAHASHVPLEAYRAHSAAMDALFAWRLEDAERELARAAELAPGSALVECGMANLLVTRFTNHRTEDRNVLYQAIGHAAAAHALDPEMGEPLWAQGRALNALGHGQPALDALRAAVAREPNRALYRVSLGWALTRGGDHTGACNEYAEAARLAPALDMPHYNHATDLAYAGRFAEALAAYDRASRTFPVPDWVLGDLGDGVQWYGRNELHALRAALLAWQGKAAEARGALDAARAGRTSDDALKAAEATVAAGARTPRRGPASFPPDACR